LPNLDRLDFDYSGALAQFAGKAPCSGTVELLATADEVIE
jgi:hypothetical protein